MALSRIAEAYVQIVPRIDGVATQVRSQLAGELAQAGDDAGGKMAGGVAQSFGRTLKGYIAPIAAGFAASFAAVGIGNFLKDAITNASDFNEQGTAVGQVFGKAAADIQAFAASGATSLGQSKVQILEAAKSFGIYGKAAGLAGTDNADFSKTMVGLATDLASFNNTSVDEAIQALGSGLRGEAEPLRRFGVLLDDATLRAKAMEMGLVKSTKDALSPQVKVLAAYGSIMDQTSTQQGDFARTSDGLANQQRILSANMENLSIKIGTALLPVMNNLTSFANTALIPAFSNLGSFFKDYGPVIGAFAGTLAVLTLAVNAQAIATAIWNSAIVVNTIALLANPITWVVIGIAALVAVIVLVATKTTFFSDAWRAMTSFVTTAWNATVSFLASAWNNVVSFFGSALNAIRSAVSNIFGGIVNFIRAAWNGVVSFFSGAWNAIIGFFRSALGAIGSAVSTGIGNVVNFFKNLPANILGALGNLATLLMSAGKNIIDGLLNGLKNAAQGALDYVRNLGKNIAETFKSILGIHSPSKVFHDFGKNIIDGLKEGLLSDASGVKATMKKVSDWVADALWDKRIYTKTAKGASALVKTYGDKLAPIADQHDKIVKDLADAQDKLANLTKQRLDYIAGIQSKYGSKLAIEEKTSAADAIQQLKDRIAKNQELASVMGELKTLGLSGDLYQQILDSGNLEFAKSLLLAGSTAIQELNALAAQANATALEMANSAASILYDQGIQTAQGVVDGLKSKEGELRALMGSIADEFASKISALISADTAEADAAAQAAAKKTTAKAGTTKKVTSSKAGAAVKKVTTSAKAVASKVTSKASGGKTTKYAVGGLVTRPTRALIGESGPEVIAPVKAFERLIGAGAGNGTTINYYAAPNNSLDAEAALQQAIRRSKVVGGW